MRPMMIRPVAVVLTCGWLTIPVAVAQQKGGFTTKPPAAAAKVRRTADGHPDLSGVWAFAIAIPPEGIAKVVNGQKSVLNIDRSARYLHAEISGALPWTKTPAYKPEFQAKVAELAANESKVDAVFYCGRPGVPRIGSPRRIVQLPNEFIFFYERSVRRCLPLHSGQREAPCRLQSVLLWRRSSSLERRHAGG